MRLENTLEARQLHSQRIDPRQIQASEILAWTSAELEAAIEREIAENPALEIHDTEPLGAAGGLANFALPGFSKESFLRAGDTYSQGISSSITDFGARVSAGAARTAAAAGGAGWEEDFDPFDRVAAGPTLRDHLRTQIRQASSDPRMRSLVAYLIESLDERGYLTTDRREIAERFGVPPSDIDRAVSALQTMDPPGIGASDLRECLQLQVNALEQTGEAHPLAACILSRCWDDLVYRREERIASRLRATVGDVRAAVRFLRSSLTPHPAAAFRPEWSSQVGGGDTLSTPPVRPDIIFRQTEAGFLIETPRDYESAIAISSDWKRLAEPTEARRDEATRRYARDHVDRAQSFLNAIARRGQTLRRIAAALVERQQGFLATGNRAFLRPLTRQALAEALEIDESVISRAVTEKWAQLPTGDVVPLDAFFGNAQAVREALVSLVSSEDPGNPYSDDEIADILTTRGFPLARRTVAKYRTLEKILPARLRRRVPVRGSRSKMGGPALGQIVSRA